MNKPKPTIGNLRNGTVAIYHDGNQSIAAVAALKALLKAAWPIDGYSPSDTSAKYYFKGPDTTAFWTCANTCDIPSYAVSLFSLTEKPQQLIGEAKARMNVVVAKYYSVLADNAYDEALAKFRKNDSIFFEEALEEVTWAAMEADEKLGEAMNELHECTKARKHVVDESHLFMSDTNVYLKALNSNSVKTVIAKNAELRKEVENVLEALSSDLNVREFCVGLAQLQKTLQKYT